MLRSSPSPTSWQGSPGRCCAEAKGSPSRNADGGIEIGRSRAKRRSVKRCLREVTTRWPDSRTAFWKPGSKNGARRREFYEDRSARISILAGEEPPRPDTLKQTDQRRISTKPLADGAGHTFLKASCSAGVAAFGLRGRGFWIDQLIARNASHPRCGATEAKPNSAAIQRATLPLVHTPPSGGGSPKRTRRRCQEFGRQNPRRRAVAPTQIPQGRRPKRVVAL